MASKKQAQSVDQREPRRREVGSRAKDGRRGGLGSWHPRGRDRELESSVSAQAPTLFSLSQPNPAQDTQSHTLRNVRVI